MAVEVWIVERYLPDPSVEDVLEAAACLQAATAASAVRYLSSTLLPEDETCFCHVEGPSAEAVADAYERARLPFARIVRATLVPASAERISSGRGQARQVIEKEES